MTEDHEGLPALLRDPEPMTPLPPRPGSFDEVFSRARHRRHRRLTAATGVVSVFLAGMWGGLAMGGGVTGVQDAVIGLADVVRTDPAPDDGPSTAPAVPTTRAATKVPVAAPTKALAATEPGLSTSAAVASPSVAPPPAAVAMVRGRVVDRAGRAAAGVFVYTGSFTQGTFTPDREAADITGPAGGYAVPCSGGPVLLTPWPLNTFVGPDAAGRWGATFVEAPVCARDEPPQVTTIAAGEAVAGTVGADAGCPDVSAPLLLALNGHRETSVGLGTVAAGKTFRIPGIPAGTHLLIAGNVEVPVTVEGLDVVQDVTLGCAPAPTPSVEPSPTPSPSATDLPVPTATPAPTVTIPAPSLSPGPVSSP